MSHERVMKGCPSIGGSCPPGEGAVWIDAPVFNPTHSSYKVAALIGPRGDDTDRLSRFLHQTLTDMYGETYSIIASAHQVHGAEIRCVLPPQSFSGFTSRPFSDPLPPPSLPSPSSSDFVPHPVSDRLANPSLPSPSSCDFAPHPVSDPLANPRAELPSQPLSPSRPCFSSGDPPRLLTFDGCDGLWTSWTGAALTIRTADCAPVAIWDAFDSRHALVHSGWRGTLQNIVGRAIRLLIQHGSKVDHLNVWVGPAICPFHYPVGDSLRSAFAQQWPEWDDCWPDHNLDLPGIIRRQALAEQIPEANIQISNRCTFGDSSELPSHRRQGDNRSLTLHTLSIRLG